MKITNKQLTQIIKEELEKVLNEMTRNEYEFQKRRKSSQPIAGDDIVLGSEDPMATPHPQRHKLYNMLKSGKPEDKNQAIELAKAVEDPLEISASGDNKTLPIFDKSKDHSFGHRFTDSGIEIHFDWDPRQQQYVVSYQIPYGYPGGGGGQGGFLNYDSYNEALKSYMMEDKNDFLIILSICKCTRIHLSRNRRACSFCWSFI